MPTKQRNQAGQVTRPDEAALRDLVYVDLLTDQQIATTYGVTAQAVAYWRKHPRDGSKPIERQRIYRQGKELYRHQDLIPWRLKQDHLNDGIADTLRLASRIRQGDKTVSTAKRRQVEQLLTFLEQHGRSINYDRDRGFTLPRKGESDQVYTIGDGLSVAIRSPATVARKPSAVRPTAALIDQPVFADVEAVERQDAAAPRKASRSRKASESAMAPAFRQARPRKSSG